MCLCMCIVGIVSEVSVCVWSVCRCKALGVNPLFNECVSHHLLKRWGLSQPLSSPVTVTINTFFKKCPLRFPPGCRSKHTNTRCCSLFCGGECYISSTPGAAFRGWSICAAACSDELQKSRWRERGEVEEKMKAEKSGKNFLWIVYEKKEIKNTAMRWT